MTTGGGNNPTHPCRSPSGILNVCQLSRAQISFRPLGTMPSHAIPIAPRIRGYARRNGDHGACACVLLVDAPATL